MRASGFASGIFLATFVASPVLGGDYRFVRIADSRDGALEFDPARRPVINSAGTVTFYANAPVIGSGYYQGIGGPIATVVTNATMDLGGRTLYSPSMNDSGQIAFIAENLAAADRLRVYRADASGALTLIANSGAGSFNSIGVHPSLNNGGGVAFQAPNGGVGVAGIWMGTGVSAPTRMYGGVGTDVTAFSSNPSLNNIGTVSFAGSYPFAVGSTAHLKGASETPGVIADGRNDISSFLESTINDGGVVAFGATRFSAPQGLFYGSGGAVIMTYADVTGPYSDLPRADGIGAGGFPALNNPGTIAFLGKLDAGGAGIFTGADPATSRVIQTGSTLFGRSVNDFFGGLDREALNDSGEIVFQAQLFDGGFSRVVAKAVPYSAQKWGADSDGSWSSGGNWVGPVPDAYHHDANFTDAITAPRTITVDGGFTVGSINFDNANTYTLAGPGSITLNDSTGGGKIEVKSGHHVIGVPLSAPNSNLIIADATSLRVDASGLSGVVNKSGGGILKINQVAANKLNITAGTVQVLPNGGPSGTSRVSTLQIAGALDAWTAKLDVTDNDLIIDYPSGGPSVYATVSNQIKNGYNSGSWSGNGIVSSLADASTKGLGYADNVVLGLTSFSGESVDPTSVLIKYTFYGDSDLDGDVDIADLGNLASNWQTSNVWTGGDFDYNGSVNVNDLGLLASNWQAGVGTPLGPSFAEAVASVGLGNVSVPEPAAVGWVLAVALQCHRRGGRGKSAS